MNYTGGFCMYKKDKIESLAKSLKTFKVAIYHSNRYGIKQVLKVKRWSCGICMRTMREIF